MSDSNAENCPYSMRSDPSDVANAVLRNHEVGPLFEDYLQKERMYAEGRYSDSLLVDYTEVNAHREVAIGAVSYLGMLHFMQLEVAKPMPIMDDTKTASEQFDALLKPRLEEAHERTVSLTSAEPYRALGTQLSKAVERWSVLLPEVIDKYPDFVGFDCPPYKYTVEIVMHQSIVGNVGSVEALLLPLCIAQARRNSRPPTSEELSSAARIATLGMVATTTMPRAVFAELQYGRRLRQKRTHESHTVGKRKSPGQFWRNALEEYEQTRDPAVFSKPAAEYDTALLAPDTPPHLHSKIEKGRLPFTEAGRCAGQIIIVPTDDELRITDPYYRKYGLEGTPSYGVMSAEVVTRATVEAAERTLFTSDVWREGVYKAAQAVNKRVEDDIASGHSKRP